ncbi:hypothetical protein CYMTET_33721 [Cymbomonas tetramitiformis]|uniref:Uncharacterized protein n=1 Tax=Cymbomonas tetramitiformis TaxID=36881 RepID=A0AAE0FCD4_9CHLO|nr:hypothetical protein CYMTET_33721 [Cymbomonas tetramitiformis]
MTRRLLQTGMVVVVDLCLGSAIAVLYAVMVAFVSIILHQRCNPYKEDSVDELQLVILCNQFVVQLLILFLMSHEAEGIDHVLLSMQMAVLFYAMMLLAPSVVAMRKILHAKAENVSQELKRAVTQQFPAFIVRENPLALEDGRNDEQSNAAPNGLNASHLDEESYSTPRSDFPDETTAPPSGFQKVLGLPADKETLGKKHEDLAGRL